MPCQGMQKHHIHRVLPYPCIHAVYLKALPGQSGAYDTDAPVKHSSFRRFSRLSPAKVLRRRVHLPENQSLRTCQNKKERYRILWNQRTFRPVFPLHTGQIKYDRA